jgi:hypothetical protein
MRRKGVIVILALVVVCLAAAGKRSLALVSAASLAAGAAIMSLGSDTKSKMAERFTSSPADRLLKGGGDTKFSCPRSEKKEGFASAPTKDTFLDSPLPGATPPFIEEAPDDVEVPANYPGAIDFEDTSAGPTFGTLNGDVDRPSSNSPDADDPGSYGHRDRTERDPQGNPFDLARIAVDKAPTCRDDEANADELDIDESNTYQARSRNDATRVTAGTMRRLHEMDKYFREEVEEREDIPWWGRHEL